MTEYTLDENGKIVTVTYNGKAIKKGYLAAIKKAQELPYWHLYTGEQMYEVQGVRLTSFGYSIWSFIRNWERRYSAGGIMGVKYAGAPIQTFDNMRYLLTEITPNGYDLIN